MRVLNPSTGLLLVWEPSIECVSDQQVFFLLSKNRCWGNLDISSTPACAGQWLASYWGSAGLATRRVISKKARFIFYSDQKIALSLFGVYVLARYFVPLKLSRSLNSDSSMADSDMPGEMFLVRGRLFKN